MKKQREFWISAAMLLMVVAPVIPTARAQSIRFPWGGYSRNPQHDCISPIASQPMTNIHWQTAVDLNPQYNGGELFIHYGTPLITRSNTVIVPVKTGALGGFRFEAHSGANGSMLWTQATDYVLPPHNWVPCVSGVLTPKNRLYFPGIGGTVYYRDFPDSTNALPVTGQIAFYGMTNYLGNTNGYVGSVYVNTPITSDRYGNIFFGFQVTGSNPLNLVSGLARIDFNGTGSWIAATNAAGDSSISKIVMNCAPALSGNHRVVYVAVNSCSYCGYNNGYGYLVALDSRTLMPLTKIRLKDVLHSGSDSYLLDDGTASPTVGPDGDVYFGVFESACCSENHERGWLLHFDSALATNKIPGAFGWDDTASVVPASMVPSYHGGSPYLLMTKYNNYFEAGGNGVNRIAILDPRVSETETISGATTMNEVLSIAGPTPDAEYTNSSPNAVREWCINSAAIDPATKSVLANNEDGKLYRWDLTSNMLTQVVTLTSGVGEAYTPTLIGIDGTVYAINNAILFAVGQ